MQRSKEGGANDERTGWADFRNGDRDQVPENGSHPRHSRAEPFGGTNLIFIGQPRKHVSGDVGRARDVIERTSRRLISIHFFGGVETFSLRWTEPVPERIDERDEFLAVIFLGVTMCERVTEQTADSVRIFLVDLLSDYCLVRFFDELLAQHLILPVRQQGRNDSFGAIESSPKHVVSPPRLVQERAE